MVGNVLTLLLCFATAFIVAFEAVPSIIKVSQQKKLFAVPNQRSSHKVVIPNLGGIAIFAGFMVSSGIWLKEGLVQDWPYLISAAVLTFFIGLKDDILIIAPWTKLGGQILAASILIIAGGIRITSLHGFFGVKEVNLIYSLLLSLFAFIVIINSFNLIDGIDGLAAGTSIVCSLTYCIWFFYAGKMEYAIISAALIGASAAFFLYNVYGTTNKIFMGDTGSQLIGLILAFLTIKFCQMNIDKSTYYHIEGAPSVAFGILILPLFDTLRVIFIRLIIKTGIFSADRNHIHHRVIALGLSHKKATFIIVFFNIFFILLSFYLSFYTSIRRLLLIILVLAEYLSFLPIYLGNKFKKHKTTDMDQPCDEETKPNELQ